MVRRNVGTWAGPGILLLDGTWRHVDPARLTQPDIRALQEAATACVGRDAGMIDIQRAPSTARDVVAP